MTNWDKTADLAQQSIDHFFKSEDPKQNYNNYFPLESEADNAVFNYWWIAHLVEVRLDAYERTADPTYLDSAEAIYLANKARNGQTLIHDYYDDMLWNALAAHRLYLATDKKRYLEDAQLVFDHLVENSWNEMMGGGFSWRRQQPYYKNTPVNAPFIILAGWLYQTTGKAIYLEWAEKTYRWLTNVLLRSDDFVEDGINREEDGKIDTQWQFTYNQGVYIGANLVLYANTKNEDYLDQAKRTADRALTTLVKEEVFYDEGEGGDEGLFKGILYRYLADLIAYTMKEPYIAFLENSLEIMLRGSEKEGYLLMDKDWKAPHGTKVPFSAEISGAIALEMVAKINRGVIK